VKYSDLSMPEKYTLKWQPAIAPQCKGGFQPMLGSMRWLVKLAAGVLVWGTCI